MAMTSNNGTQSREPLAVVTEKVHAMSTNWKMAKPKKDTPVNHAPYTVAIPSGMTENAWLIRLARKGATIVTLANGERVAQLGHAVRMIEANGKSTWPTFAPRATRTRRGTVNGVSVSRALGASNADLARGNASEY